MKLLKTDIKAAIKELELSKKVICIHSSYRSFGGVENGPQAIIDAFLEEECTIVVPTFSAVYNVKPPKEQWIQRNGCNFDYLKDWGKNSIYSVDSNEVNDTMGIIPRLILRMEERKRGNHPLNSFTAIGPFAKKIIGSQTPLNVYAPIREIGNLDGYFILIGVDLTRLTAIHYAEQLAGRRLFRRWANGQNGLPIQAEVGSCSAGFNNFEQQVETIERRKYVGNSLCRVFQSNELINIITEEIRSNPKVTHCGNKDCERCRDIIAGGPILYS
jgi:aminoglycoside N3'-acetyltransferase